MGRINQDKTILVKAFLVLVLVSMANWSADAAEQPPWSLALPGCQDTCGNLTNIPYPFGIEPGCFLDPLYQIDCQQNRGISTPVLKNFSMVVSDIMLPQSSSSPGLIRVRQPIWYSNHTDKTVQLNDYPVGFLSENRVFRFSPSKNTFVAGGCDIQALMAIHNSPGDVIGCKSPCGRNGTLGFYQCLSNDGCCTISIPDDIIKYKVEFSTLRGEALPSQNPECGYAFLVEAEWWFQADLNGLPPDVPAMLEWAITPNEEVLLSKQSNRHHNDKSGSRQTIKDSIRVCQKSNGGVSCQTPRNATRISCACNQGYEGNYFLPHGCQGELKTSPSTSYLNLVLYPKLGRTPCELETYKRPASTVGIIEL